MVGEIRDQNIAENISVNERGPRYHDVGATIIDIIGRDESLRQPSKVRKLGVAVVTLFTLSIGALVNGSDSPEVPEASVAVASTITLPPLEPGDRRSPDAAPVTMTKPSSPDAVTTITTAVPEIQKTAEAKPANKLFKLQNIEVINPIDRYIKLLPRLDGLVAQGKMSPEAAAEQKAHIEKLRNETVVTRPEYDKFEKSQVDNTSYVNVFSGHPYFNDRIRATKIVLHWAGNHYVDVPDMANKMMSAKSPDGSPDRRNVQFMIDRTKLFRTTPSDRIFRGAHAPGANDDSIGIEHNRITKMIDVQPVDAKVTAMGVVYIARRNNIEINERNIWTHAGIDLMHNNPGYDRETGTINGNMRKFDYPQDYLFDVILPLAKAIDAGLGPRT